MKNICEFHDKHPNQEEIQNTCEDCNKCDNCGEVTFYSEEDERIGLEPWICPKCEND